VEGGKKNLKGDLVNVNKASYLVSTGPWS
jgi:hypothetical protein